MNCIRAKGIYIYVRCWLSVKNLNACDGRIKRAEMCVQLVQAACSMYFRCVFRVYKTRGFHNIIFL